MRLTNVYKGLLLSLALLLATSMFAGTISTKGSLQVLDTVSLSGTQLAPGQYSVKWDGKGPNVEISIMQGHKVVATTSARIIDLSESASSDSLLTTKAADGSKSVSEIRFGGKKYALEIGQESANAADGAGK